jgi:hypothetical protein
MRLHVARGRKAEATGQLEDWLADPGLDPGWLEPAITEVGRKGWQDVVDAAVEKAVREKSCHPGLARTWIAPWAAGGDFEECSQRLRKLAGRDAQLAPALALLLETASRARDRKPVERALKEHAGLVQRDPAVWGTVGYAYVALGEHDKARRWLEGWSRRSGVMPWMLYNLVLALAYAREWQQALMVSRGALRLPADHATNDHVVWLLADQALAKDLGPADASVRRLEGARLEPRFEFLRALAMAVIGLRRGKDFAWFKREVAQAEASLPGFGREPDLRHAYVRGVWRAARGQRGLGAMLWGVSRWFSAERGLPLASLFAVIRESPLEVMAPPSRPTAAPLRRRAGDA